MLNIKEINQEYEEYCKKDGKKKYHLPFILWLIHVKKIDPNDYYDEEENQNEM